MFLEASSHFADELATRGHTRRAEDRRVRVSYDSVPGARGQLTFVVERDRLQLGEPLASVSVAQEDRELVIDEFAAALGEDRRTVGETCAVFLVAAGRRASHAAAFWQHVAKGSRASAAERVTNQERQRIEPSKSSRENKCRQQGRSKATNRLGKSAELPNELRLPSNHGQGELSLTREGGWRSLLRKDGVEIGNSG